MLEIPDIRYYNEMMRYERDMDQLRALALWITQYDGSLRVQGLSDPKEYVFDIIKFYSTKLATDIFHHGNIDPDSLALFHDSLFSIQRLLGITPQDVSTASQQQRYRNSGFWEMRRGLGQFSDIAELVIHDGNTHIVTAAVSGCIIGEYLGLVALERHQHILPVDHMVFAREGIEPVSGVLAESCQLTGDQILIVDDAVMETRTSRVMIGELKKIRPNATISLFTVDIDPDTKSSGYLNQFSHVYMFEET